MIYLRFHHHHGHAKQVTVVQTVINHANVVHLDLAHQIQVHLIQILHTHPAQTVHVIKRPLHAIKHVKKMR